MKVNRRGLSVGNYVAPDGKLLIEPFSHMKRTVEVTDFELKPTEEGEDPTKADETAEPEYIPVQRKERAPYEIQLAKVVAVSGKSDMKVGDTIIYSVKFVKEFDLFKDIFLMSEYDSYGRYTGEVG